MDVELWSNKYGNKISGRPPLPLSTNALRLMQLKRESSKMHTFNMFPTPYKILTIMKKLINHFDIQSRQDNLLLTDTDPPENRSFPPPHSANVPRRTETSQGANRNVER